jgi:hypothetical protein
VAHFEPRLTGAPINNKNLAKKVRRVDPAFLLVLEKANLGLAILRSSLIM